MEHLNHCLRTQANSTLKVPVALEQGMQAMDLLEFIEN